MLIPIIALMIPIVVIFTKSAIGLAIADAIRHNSGASQGAERRELEQMQADLEQVRAELDQLRAELSETHERLDFADRLLARPTAVPADLREMGGGT